MNRAYWNAVADSYKSEIFSVLEHDTRGLIRKRVTAFAGRDRTAADLGCGVGHFLPLLTGGYSRVHACDLSQACLDRAMKAHRELQNVSYGVCDLAAGRIAIPPVDFALCINVLITSSLSVRARMFRNLKSYLLENGHILIVVPSVESALLTSARLIQWNQREGHPASEAEKIGLPCSGSVRQIHRGNIPIDGVITKHYLKEELEFLLPDNGLEVLEVEKICYSWTTEFAEPPDWMTNPHPWDWMVLARRA
ncbi:MAG: class I SAM-dependent methyltransferase [Verrucomicrobia bacterium]|nr:MAG: class I SAM-dependent methyltransferase [Verrucomicrobiota bacterium]